MKIKEIKYDVQWNWKSKISKIYKTLSSVAAI